MTGRAAKDGCGAGGSNGDLRAVGAPLLEFARDVSYNGYGLNSSSRHEAADLYSAEWSKERCPAGLRLIFICEEENAGIGGAQTNNRRRRVLPARVPQGRPSRASDAGRGSGDEEASGGDEEVTVCVTHGLSHLSLRTYPGTPCATPHTVRPVWRGVHGPPAPILGKRR